MLDTLNEEELNKIDQLTTSMKEQISIRSGKTMGDVNRLALFYNQSLLIHRWLALK